MTAAILPIPARRAVPKIGDRVICHRDGKTGTIEQIIENKIGKPALAAVRVQGGFGLRCLSFADFRAAPARRKADRA